ncbi:MAG: ABC transporter ATP-binding protein [Wenzhouxiangellaceae bacterium]
MSVLVRVDQVGKAYPPAAAQAGRLRAVWQLLRTGRPAGGAVVLDDISFEVRRGESLALIGSNGAGKSTLLKLVTGVQTPTRGRIEVSGRISALLELGAGFEPDYTGLENLKINAALLGLSRDQISARMDDILAFADLGDAIHKPIRHYSSGMVVRLGFAIAASVRPDLLITDEVLAVGDESFQKKCIRWVEGYLNDGGTLLMVSHNMYQVQKLCRQAIWLEQGRIRMQGDVFDVTQAYLAWHESRGREARAADTSPARYRVRSLDLHFPDSRTGSRIEMGEPLKITLELHSPDERPPVALVGLVRADGTPVYGVATDHDGVVPVRIDEHRWAVGVEFPSLPLLPGGYRVRAHAMDPEGLRVFDSVEREFMVGGRSRALGLVALPHRWFDPER